MVETNPTIQFFVIVPAENAEVYRCEIPIKNDVTNYTQFITNSYRMTVHGLLEYEGKSFVHVLVVGNGMALIESVAELTGIENPFSVANYKATNEILSQILEATFCPRFEDIYFYHPELEGTEMIDGGEGELREKDIIIKSTWSGNPLDYDVFE